MTARHIRIILDMERSQARDGVWHGYRNGGKYRETTIRLNWIVLHCSNLQQRESGSLSLTGLFNEQGNKTGYSYTLRSNAHLLCLWP